MNQSFSIPLSYGEGRFMTSSCKISIMKSANPQNLIFIYLQSRRTLNETDDFQVNHSESGGNESDNSNEEPLSVASDTNLLQRNNVIRRSLQRKSNIEPPILPRGGVRSSFQSLKRESTPNRITHRNSIHGYVPVYVAH